MTKTQADPSRMTDEEIRAAVRERYAATATVVLNDLGSATSCCTPVDRDPMTRALYDNTEAAQVPQAALAASLGCGNPTALAQLRAGQVVLDLGSGGGLDVLLSARRVGSTGKAYGLDMTPEMLELARRNQAETGLQNATFLLGTIENIPLPDESVDVIISNCVINLAADKDRVLREAFRVLRPGGRLAVSDVILLRPLPDVAHRAMTLWTGCISGALVDTDYRDKGGFQRSSQHLDVGGVAWRLGSRRRLRGRRRSWPAGVGSGRRIGRCGRRCVRPGGPSLRARSSVRSGG